MPTTCGFPNCKFRSRYRGQEDNRHFYRIPKRPCVLRQRWLDAIGRTEETVVSQVGGRPLRSSHASHGCTLYHQCTRCRMRGMSMFTWPTAAVVTVITVQTAVVLVGFESKFTLPPTHTAVIDRIAFSISTGRTMHVLVSALFMSGSVDTH